MSGEHQTSGAFDLLAEPVRRWIWRQGWSELRGLQEESIPLILEGGRDLIIAAGTASGKTEAAFLPIISSIVAAPSRSGFSALYLAPLKALINDQFRRVDAMCADLDVQVVKWHGDVGSSHKAAARKSPEGILLMTPESLEATMMRRPESASRLFRVLQYVVIDEMHAFLEGPRGYQVQSLLARLEQFIDRRPDRIGLSATLADMAFSARFLRPDDPERVLVIDHSAQPRDVKLQLRGYVKPGEISRGVSAGLDPAMSAMIRHVFDTLRDRRGLIFAGSRQKVEAMTADLKGLCDEHGIPDRFFAHHGSLARDERESAEQRLRDETRPGSIVATTTLELGIDVGGIDEVAQYGPGTTTSGMMQRLGRSGRREGQISTMRLYVIEPEIHERTHPVDMLRLDLVQTVAMVNLMIQRWNEPPSGIRADLSTLVHQVLAIIFQKGGATAADLWSSLVETRVFNVPRDVFAGLLRSMGKAQLIEQAPDGLLLPGQLGETLASRHDFYGVFKASDELRVVSDTGKVLGMLPASSPLAVGQLIILAGRRWEVRHVHETRREVTVAPGKGGKPPAFEGEPAGISAGVAVEMKRVLESTDSVRYADEVAAGLLAEARENYRMFGLDRGCSLRFGDEILLFPWTGSSELETLSLAMMAAGAPSARNGLVLMVPAFPEGCLEHALAKIAGGPEMNPLDLAGYAKNKVLGKYDGHLAEELLTWGYAASRIQTEGLRDIAANLLAGCEHPALLDS